MDSAAYTEDEWQKINAEFQRMNDNHYLDHAGAGLYSERQVKEIVDNLSTHFYSNPHTSKLTEDIVDQVRYRILQHFNTSSQNYEVIFTANATAALKTLAETFDFNYHGEARENADIKIPGAFVYTIDNHVSVLGMREVVQTNHIRCIEREELLQNIERQDRINGTHLFLAKNSSLLVFPGQSNFCGFKYPLELIEKIQKNGLHENQATEGHDTEWYVCIDAACLVSTSPLDLARYPADFICVSFNKMFGYPTGLGCLLVSKRAEMVLKKKYYGGGTIQVALATKNWHKKRKPLHERFEDGTVSYLSIVSLMTGFNTIERLVPSTDTHTTMSRISSHVFRLAKYFYEEGSKLRHNNGNPVLHFYNETKYKSCKYQGGICAFILLNEDETFVGYSEFDCIANLHNIHVRTGCFCNPGACQRHLELSDEIVLHNYQAGHICGDTVDLVDGRPTGAIRASFGYMTTKENVDALLHLIKKCFMNKGSTQVESRIAINGKKTKHEDLNGNGLSQKDCLEVELTDICLYPIKSCGAFKVKRWPINSKGLKYDREWLILTNNGVALTQKQETKMCRIKPILTDDHLILTFPNASPIKIELKNKSKNSQSNEISMCQSKVCNDNIQGDDCGDEVAAWLLTVLNIPGLRLIRQNTEQKRFMKNSSHEIKKEISLANKSQFLVVNKTSVEWLVQQINDWNEFGNLADIVNNAVDRFRGNLIIKTKNELEENKFVRLFSHNEIQLEMDGPCTRCQMICIDQGTGEKTAEPLRTLVKALKGKMRFGVYFSQILQENDDNKERFLDCNQQLYAFLE